MIRTKIIKNLKEIEMKLLMLEQKVKIKKIWNNLDEFEMNELEAKVNAEIKILANK